MTPADDEDWTTHARCRDHLPLFDSIVDSPGTATKLGWVAEAAAVCRACPVRPQCAAYAVERIGNPHHGTTLRHGCHGYWAGTFYGANDIDTTNDEEGAA
jgi:hypothetical protein